MKTALVHPFGNPNAYHAALALDEQGWLEQFHTCLFNPWNSGRRWFPQLCGARVHRHQAFEWLRLAATKLPAGPWNGRSPQFVDRAGTWCDGRSSRGLTAALDAVYCYEDFALASFRQARRLGVRCVYDLPTCYYKAAHSALAAEVEREPALRLFVYELREPAEKLIRKEEEIGLATQIVCASSFTRQTIPTGIRDRTPVTVIPYGADTARPCRTWTPEDFRGKLKLIFAGSLGPRKGIHVLFEALHGLSPRSYELSLAGRWVPGFEAFLNSKFSVNYKFLGRLRGFELTEAYLRSHLLVFPSLADGFGLVLLEAMACGIPVVTTERTGGPDLLQQGGGYLVKAGDADALRARIEEIMCSRRDLPEVSSAARRVAEQHSWQRYRAELVAALHAAAITAESPTR